MLVFFIFFSFWFSSPYVFISNQQPPVLAHGHGAPHLLRQCLLPKRAAGVAAGKSSWRRAAGLGLARATGGGGGSSSSPAWRRVKGHPKEGDSGPIASLQTWRDWSCSGARFLSRELARVPGPKIPHATKSCRCVWRARPPELDLALACTTATTELHAQTSLMTTFSLLLPHCWRRSSMRTSPHPKRDVPIC